MATGDLEGNVNRLLQELRAVKYPEEMDDVGLRLGDPICCLRILHHALLDYSDEVASHLLENHYELRSKTDKKFMELAFRSFREIFDLKPVLTSAQMLQQGFAERKILLLCSVLEKCRKLNEQLLRRRKLQALRMPQNHPRMNDYSRNKQMHRSYIEKACQKRQIPFASLTNTLVGLKTEVVPTSLPSVSTNEVTEDPTEDKSMAHKTTSVVDIDNRSEIEYWSHNEEREEEEEEEESFNSSLRENLEAIRDSRGIKPQTQTRTAVQSNEISDLSWRLQCLEEQFNELKEWFSITRNQCMDKSQNQDEKEDILNRLNQLETRIKFLEAESHQQKASSQETELILKADSSTRFESDLVHKEDMVAVVKAPSTVEELIAELTVRQSSAESYLQEYRKSTT